jgi:hypothetical protein
MMDREKKDELPKMQGRRYVVDDQANESRVLLLVGFIDSICLPLYKVSE